MPDETPAADVAALLRSAGRRLVLAESCTAGLVAATLAQIPGISEHLCGSAVVYRAATKSAWLGIDPQLLDDPLIGPVSAEVTRAMALAVLERTPEANLSAAVTGHLGPNAPPELDGVVHVAVAERDAQPAIVAELREVLPMMSTQAPAMRVARQQRAADLVLGTIATALRG
jgi:PncC family amidohydrolase